MTDRAEIERLLQMTGRTLESVSKIEVGYGSRRNGKTESIIKHQSDVIELLIGALRDALTERDAALAKVPGWISVEERLPENEERVFITERHEGFYGKPWSVAMTAFHTDGKTLAEDSDYNWSEGSVEMQYDEEADDFIVPEGWWEDVQCGDEFSMVNGRVTHWMPLPELPKEGN